ncbi:MAG: 23S rRNA (pseudouridine(1915)-N(3))-methyltransferase RlmH [Candidatus Promineifilaceae bacterium]
MSNGKMGQIVVAAVGRLKKSPWKVAQGDYLKRLQHYTNISLAEVKDSVGRGFPDAVAMQREGEALLAATEGAQRLILLTPAGRQFTSEQFSAYLLREIELYGRLAFLIGGPLGFDPGVEAAADEQMALSSLTFPHEMARVVLLEQLYRAFTILRSEPYHK